VCASFPSARNYYFSIVLQESQGVGTNIYNGNIVKIHEKHA